MDIWSGLVKGLDHPHCWLCVRKDDILGCKQNIGQLASMFPRRTSVLHQKRERSMGGSMLQAKFSPNHLRPWTYQNKHRQPTSTGSAIYPWSNKANIISKQLTLQMLYSQDILHPIRGPSLSHGTDVMWCKTSPLQAQKEEDGDSFLTHLLSSHSTLRPAWVCNLLTYITNS